MRKFITLNDLDITQHFCKKAEMHHSQVAGLEIYHNLEEVITLQLMTSQGGGLYYHIMYSPIDAPIKFVSDELDYHEADYSKQLEDKINLALTDLLSDWSNEYLPEYQQ